MTIALLTIEQAMTLMAFGGAEGTTSAQIAQRTALSWGRSIDLLRDLYRLKLCTIGGNGLGELTWHLTTEGRSRRRMLFRMIQGVARD